VEAIGIGDEAADGDVVCDHVASVSPKKRAVWSRSVARFDSSDIERGVRIGGHWRERLRAGRPGYGRRGGLSRCDGWNRNYRKRENQNDSSGLEHNAAEVIILPDHRHEPAFRELTEKPAKDLYKLRLV
jgi:hypothetical protein